MNNHPVFSIAVLDNDHALADNITSYLNRTGGFKAEPFYSDSGLSKALLTQSYDGYIIDWHLTNGTAESIIKTIRQKNRAQPIYLLTGQIEDECVTEQLLSKIVSLYNLIVKEKPTRISIITAELMKTLTKN